MDEGQGDKNLSYFLDIPQDILSEWSMSSSYNLVDKHIQFKGYYHIIQLFSDWYIQFNVEQVYSHSRWKWARWQPNLLIGTYRGLALWIRAPNAPVYLMFAIATKTDVSIEGCDTKNGYN